MAAIERSQIAQYERNSCQDKGCPKKVYSDHAGSTKTRLVVCQDLLAKALESFMHALRACNPCEFRRALGSAVAAR
jgi:hypothetical protein